MRPYTWIMLVNCLLAILTEDELYGAELDLFGCCTERWMNGYGCGTEDELHVPEVVLLWLLY